MSNVIKTRQKLTKSRRVISGISIGHISIIIVPIHDVVVIGCHSPGSCYGLTYCHWTQHVQVGLRLKWLKLVSNEKWYHNDKSSYIKVTVHKKNLGLVAAIFRLLWPTAIEPNICDWMDWNQCQMSKWEMSKRKAGKMQRYCQMQIFIVHQSCRICWSMAGAVE